MTEDETQRALALTNDERVGMYQWELNGHRYRLESEPTSLGLFWRLWHEWSVQGWVGACPVSHQEAQNHLSEHFRAWLAERGWYVRLSFDRGGWWVICTADSPRRGPDIEGYFPALLTGVELCLADDKEK